MLRSAVAFSGRRTYLRDRSCGDRLDMWGFKPVSSSRTLETYQEESIGQKGISEQRPPDPTSCSLTSVENFANDYGHDDSHKLISRIRNQVKELRLVADGKQIAAKLKGQDLDYDNGKGRSSR